MKVKSSLRTATSYAIECPTLPAAARQGLIAFRLPALSEGKSLPPLPAAGLIAFQPFRLSLIAFQPYEEVNIPF